MTGFVDRPERILVSRLQLRSCGNLASIGGAFPYPVARADYPMNKYLDTPEAADEAIY